MHNSPTIRIAALSLVTLSVLIGACGGSDDKKSDTPAAAATKPAAASTSAATKAAAPTAVPTKTAATAPANNAATPRSATDKLNVVAKDFSFALNLTSVRPGIPGVDVFFQNSGSATHTIAFYEDAAFTKKLGESQPVAGGARSGFPFVPPAAASMVYYRCEIHPNQMKGELVVK